MTNLLSLNPLLLLDFYHSCYQIHSRAFALFAEEPSFFPIGVIREIRGDSAFSSHSRLFA